MPLSTNAPTAPFWIERFPGLSRLDAPLKATLTDSARIINVPEGTQIFGPANSPETMLFLLSGSVRVQ